MKHQQYDYTVLYTNKLCFVNFCKIFIKICLKIVLIGYNIIVDEKRKAVKMKQGNVEKIERVNYLLEIGIDFQANDLVPDIGGFKILSNEYLNEFFRNEGKWVWVGHFDKNTQTIKVKVEKELFC